MERVSGERMQELRRCLLALHSWHTARTVGSPITAISKSSGVSQSAIRVIMAGRVASTNYETYKALIECFDRTVG